MDVDFDLGYTRLAWGLQKDVSLPAGSSLHKRDTLQSSVSQGTVLDTSVSWYSIWRDVWISRLMIMTSFLSSCFLLEVTSASGICFTLWARWAAFTVGLSQTKPSNCRGHRRKSIHDEGLIASRVSHHSKRDRSNKMILSVIYCLLCILLNFAYSIPLCIQLQVHILFLILL